MPAELIEGKVVSEQVRSAVAAAVAKLPGKPCLAVVLVGDDPASAIYVKSKGEKTEAAGMRSIRVTLTACLVPLSVTIPWTSSVPLVLAVSAVVVLAHMSWLTNLGAMVVDIVPEGSVGRVFGLVAAGSSVGGIIMNTVVAAMISGPTAAPAGFLDRGIHAVFGSVLQLVQGQGYALWFLLMAFLHPAAWLLLKFTPTKSPA